MLSYLLGFIIWHLYTVILTPVLAIFMASYGAVSDSDYTVSNDMMSN
jgi:hypothetical protein